MTGISAPPLVIYVDSTYPSALAAVNFPNNGLRGPYTVGLDAFNTIQQGVNHVADLGTVNVAAGTYIENVTIGTRLSLIGPNAGKAGTNLTRAAEAKIIPAVNDPETTPILSVETNNITIAGFLLDGNNPALGVGYPGNGPQLYAAAGVQNGVVDSYLLDVSNIRIQNNIIRNVSYDGVYLDRADYSATTTGGNYILNNKFENMYEGVSTYNLDSVIACNTFTNLNHGIGVHVVTHTAPGFTPLIASNNMTIAQWWPPGVVHAPGIWVNYRNGAAPALDVKWNVISTPTPIPAGNSIFALYALSVNGSSKVNFIDNTVNGSGICTEGLFVSVCTRDNVNLIGGSLNNILSEGVLANTLDPNWGPGDAFVTVSNVNITLSTSSGIGVLALQENSTPRHNAGVAVLGNTSIIGGGAGVAIEGTNAAAVVKNNSNISANAVGIDVNGGKALVENNNLVGNSIAGILIENDGIVDAGNCWATNNVTGLGFSAGLNILSGYGFDGFTPWAIKNLSSKTVYAQNNTYGATPNEILAAAFFGAVIYSQNGGTPISCPPAKVVETLERVPAADTTVAAFFADNGLAADTSGTLSSSDNILTNSPGHYFVTRTYRLTDICGQVSSCAQSISVQQTFINLIGFTGGYPSLSINGLPGHRYSIQASTNLVDWFNLVTNTAPYAYIDTCLSGFPHCFYRAQILP